MSYLERDIYGIYKNTTGPGPHLMGADTLIGDDVYNHKEEKLGDIKEIMLDMRNGRIGYAVLSYGGVFSIGEKLFAVPWTALKLDTTNKRFILNVDKQRLKNAPGFDKNNWPDMTDQTWSSQIHSYYESPSYMADLP
jgi:sporulation protein YlmC with PRC-barrel domain